MKVTSLALLMLVVSAKVHPAHSGQNIQYIAHKSEDEANEAAAHAKNPNEESEKAKRQFDQDEKER